MLTCLFVAVAAVDAVLALQPALLTSLRSHWQDALPSDVSPWSTLAAAAVIVGAVALAASIMAGFVRGVRSAPYLSLGPLWVGSCMLVIGRLQFELPLPLPTPAFVASCALLFLGGGALFERKKVALNVVGALFCLLPPLLLGLGYALLPNSGFDGNAALLLTVVVLASAGAPIIAIATRALTAWRDAPVQNALELAEQLRDAEDRALRAERQLAALPAWSPSSGAGPRLMLEADELTPAFHAEHKARWVAPLLIALTVGAAAAAYALAYRPLRSELAEQLRHNARLSAAQAEAIASLRADYEREKQALEQQLTAARQPVQAAPEPDPVPAPALAPADPAAERRAARLAKREEALAAREQRASEQQAAREQRAAEQQAAREQRATEQQVAREQRAAEQQTAREQRAAEQQAARAQHAAAKPPAREPRAAEQQAAPTEGDAASQEAAEARAAEQRAVREQRAAERQAAREQRAAERQAAREERLNARTEGEVISPPAPDPAAPPRDSMESSNDDPLEGLDGI